MTPLAVYVRAIKAIGIAAKSDVKKLPVEAQSYYRILPTIVEAYGNAAATAAADFYDAMRQGSGIEDTFVAIIPELKDLGTDELVGWAVTTALSPETLPAIVAGGVQRRVANFARETITESSYRDPKSLGWMRIGTPDCGFCAMLISRGAVYSERGATCASHDNCDCLAVPAFDLSQVRRVNSEFVASAKRVADNTSDSDRARAREWISENL